MARELWGFTELQTTTDSGWSGDGGVFVNDGRKDANGNGGEYYWAGPSNTFKQRQSPPFQSGRILKHFFLKCAVWDARTNFGAIIRWRNGASIEGGVVLGDGNDGQIEIQRGTTTLATSTDELPFEAWALIEVEVYLNNSNGFVKVWVNQPDKSGTPFVEFTGDTFNANDTASVQVVSRDSRFDDISLNSITMSVDNVSGTFQDGEQITGGTSGTTAVITSREVSGGAGVLVLHLPDGAFQDNEQITGGTSAATADVNAPTADYVDGFEPQSGHIGNEFIVLGRPNANGNSSQLTGSDGNSVDNYLLVNDVPTDGTDFVETDTAGSKDTYGTDLSSVLPSASGISEITAVEVHAFTFSDLAGINNISLLVRQGTTDFGSPDEALGVDAILIGGFFDTQPDGSGAWTHAAVTAMEIGMELKS